MRAVIGTIACFLALLAPGPAADTVILAPGYGELEYEPPAPGTYELPVLGEAVDGKVIDMHGNPTTLHEIMDGKLVLMGFIYTHCPDVNGCPLASYVMKQVQAKLVEDKELKDKVTLISLSFDPELDTPAAMNKYSQHFKRRDFEWRFLTTGSEEDLKPILDGYGQFRAKYYNEDGSYSGSMSHVLRVYLIDQDKRIRNIYSAGFLHLDTVINDLTTLEPYLGPRHKEAGDRKVDVYQQVELLISGVGLISLFLIWWQIKSGAAAHRENIKWNKINAQHALLEFLPSEDEDAKVHHLLDRYGVRYEDELPHSVVDQLSAKVADFTLLKNYLNKFEHISAAIRSGAFDGEYAFSVHGARIIFVARKYKNLFDVYRDLLNDYEIYIEIEKLGAEWAEEAAIREVRSKQIIEEARKNL